MGTRLQSTDMTTDKFESWNLDTDVVAWDDYYGATNWAGRWYCVSLVAGSTDKCNQGYVELNLSYGVQSSKVTCHEVGHSVGLGLSTATSSCLYNPAASGSSDYDTHDRSHINGRYLDRLAPRARTVLVLRYYADLDDATIAATMGISVSAVRATASRALAALREAPSLDGVKEQR